MFVVNDSFETGRMYHFETGHLTWRFTVVLNGSVNNVLEGTKKNDSMPTLSRLISFYAFFFFFSPLIHLGEFRGEETRCISGMKKTTSFSKNRRNASAYQIEPIIGKRVDRTITSL